MVELWATVVVVAVWMLVVNGEVIAWIVVDLVVTDSNNVVVWAIFVTDVVNDGLELIIDCVIGATVEDVGFDETLSLVVLMDVLEWIDVDVCWTWVAPLIVLVMVVEMDMVNEENVELEFGMLLVFVVVGIKGDVEVIITVVDLAVVDSDVEIYVGEDELINWVIVDEEAPFENEVCWFVLVIAEELDPKVIVLEE